jgi:hypothetical protein
MYEVSERLSPSSTRGLISDLCWCSLAVVIFGALIYWQPYFVELSLTATRVAGSLLIGTLLGIGLVAVSATVTFRRFWSGFGRRFIVLFVVIMGGQVLLDAVPTWTTLCTFVVSVVAIPARLYLFSRSRRQ